jgi:hypothetical protein
MQSGRNFPTFQRNLLPPYSGHFLPNNSTFLTWHHILEDSQLHYQHSSTLNTEWSIPAVHCCHQLLLSTTSANSWLLIYNKTNQHALDFYMCGFQTIYFNVARHVSVIKISSRLAHLKKRHHSQSTKHQSGERLVCNSFSAVLLLFSSSCLLISFLTCSKSDTGFTSITNRGTAGCIKQIYEINVLKLSWKNLHKINVLKVAWKNWTRMTVVKLKLLPCEVKSSHQPHYTRSTKHLQFCIDKG